MVKEAKSKLASLKPRWHTLIITIPADLAKDSAFPFKPGDRLRIRISGKRLVVERAG